MFEKIMFIDPYYLLLCKVAALFTLLVLNTDNNGIRAEKHIL